MAEVCLFDECFAVRCIFSQKGQKRTSVHAVQRELFRLDRSEKRCVRGRTVPPKKRGASRSPFKIIGQNKTFGACQRARSFCALTAVRNAVCGGEPPPQKKKRGASRSPFKIIGQNKTLGHAKERGAFAPLKFFCARREVRPKGAKKSLSFSGAKVRAQGAWGT